MFSSSNMKTKIYTRFNKSLFNSFYKTLNTKFSNLTVSHPANPRK